ncbi:MAG TPA: holin [Actinophytocola sp.]|uniref:holin n=1 Tax=Actinophytocola sp. TaxID=1872138 RepID=UPI002DDD0D72|nr:holin [Actinophytocola sp.]HEV2778535.1 holin [Actinophytocola sp.]
MFTAVFWKDTAERALKTSAQVLATVLIAAGTGLLDTDWTAALSTAGMAMVLSVLTSLCSELVHPTGTASLLMLGTARHNRTVRGGPT